MAMAVAMAMAMVMAMDMAKIARYDLCHPSSLPVTELFYELVSRFSLKELSRT